MLLPTEPDTRAEAASVPQLLPALATVLRRPDTVNTRDHSIAYSNPSAFGDCSRASSNGKP